MLKPHRSSLGLGVVIALTVTGCSSLPTFHEERTHTASFEVRLENLPNGTRIIQELPEANGEHRPLTVNANGTVALTFPYELTETVENGTVSRNTPRQADVTLSVQALGYLPRRIRVSVPGPNRIDATLERPPIAFVAGAGPALERARALLLSGRCSEAEGRFAELDEGARAALEPLRAGCAARAARRFSDDGSRDWDPKNLEIPLELAEVPEGAERTLDVLMAREKDVAGSRGLASVHRLALMGNFNESARLAALVAAPLPSKRAALVLQLPAALLARQRIHLAAQELARGDSRAAFEHAADAVAISPWSAAKAYGAVRAERIKALASRARSWESKSDAIVARAYWTAVVRLDAGSAEGREGLARTEAPLLDQMRARIVLRSNDSATGHALGELVRPLLPRHVSLSEDDRSADASLLVALSPTVRTYRASTTHQKKSVFAFRVNKENPAYEEAKQELRSAEQGEGDARDQYDQLHAAAQEMARNSAQNGTAGAIARAAAVAEEATAVALLKTAQVRLRNARSALQRTPRTVKEDVQRDVEYPVLHFEADAARTVAVQLEGLGEKLAASREAKTSLVREQTVASPQIDVEGTPSPEAELQALTPDVAPILSELAKAIGQHVVASETAQAANHWVTTRAQGHVLRTAAAAVVYLEVLPPTANERAEIDRYLVESLP